MGGVFRSVKKAVKKVTKAVTKPFKKIFKTIKKGVKKVWKGVKKVVKKVGKTFSKLGPIASIALSVFMPHMMPFLQGYGVWGAMAKGAITGFVTSGGSLKGTLIGAAGGGIGYGVGKGVSAFKSGWSSVGEKAGFTDKLMAGFDSVGTATSDGVSNMYNSAANALKSGSIKNLQYVDISGESIFKGAQQGGATDKLSEAIASGDEAAITQARADYFDTTGGGELYVDKSGQKTRIRVGNPKPEYVDPQTGKFSEDLYKKSLTEGQRLTYQQYENIENLDKITTDRGTYVFDQTAGDWRVPGPKVWDESNLMYGDTTGKGDLLGELGYGEANPYSYEYAISKGADPYAYNPEGIQVHKDYLASQGGPLPYKTYAGQPKGTTAAKKAKKPTTPSIPSSLLKPTTPPGYDLGSFYDTSPLTSAEGGDGSSEGTGGSLRYSQYTKEGAPLLTSRALAQAEKERKRAEGGYGYGYA